MTDHFRVLDAADLEPGQRCLIEGTRVLSTTDEGWVHLRPTQLLDWGVDSGYGQNSSDRFVYVEDTEAADSADQNVSHNAVVGIIRDKLQGGFNPSGDLLFETTAGKIAEALVAAGLLRNVSKP